MGAGVKKPAPRNPKPAEEIRSKHKGQDYTESEAENVDWAAKELGLSPASFIRMAALKMAKEVLR